MRYSFCPKCGGRLIAEENENKPHCKNCGFIFYQNPIVGVAAIVIYDRKILLGKRNISYSNKWCIPCGYVEYDEEIRAAARREFLEETGLHIKIKRIYDVHSNFHNPAQHTVGTWFLAEAIGGELSANDDLSAVDYFSFDRLPELAFETDQLILDKLRKENFL
ncbi:NUDIX hydrolase [Salipaludibacillus daqingensis]|uniref:NUDIX hydrolase n=1 Tax=Salipaludibacillus daqingensis TaxID=3041001 RepID=UPI002472EE5C|nr:NUDIX hydrolase [Salipaludibacillus daqingensis]